MKIITRLKSVELLKLSLFTLSISTPAYSNTEGNEISVSPIQNNQSGVNINAAPQRPRPPQPPRPPRQPQPPINAETTRLIDGTVVNTQQLVDLGNLLYTILICLTLLVSHVLHAMI